MLRDMLKARDFEVGRKHVATLMRRMGVSGWPLHLEVGRRANDDGVHLTCEVDTYALQGREAPAPWR
jgi:hypothetical protein